ncbi:glutathione synthase [Cyanobium sp. ATX 6A2]|uniref:glutathione synthase n=1 Tax=Cyanobium sp. ATX 6A2 TaxID=2823700 RepID=UPI0020CF53F5|nr:glutathione synthase [Cyanobium sp. ATX 6A2]MCP9888046.1 glutathione synthase [Cyanobium sp. ATX 6A2]
MASAPAASGAGSGAQLFVIDPIERLNPAKDSSVALMQAAERAGLPVWVATTTALLARKTGRDHTAWVWARPVRTQPWHELGDAQLLPLAAFAHVWMRKDPPVDEAYLYATHLLELAERQGVRVLNRPSALRSWNEKLSSLRWSHLMAPTLVASRVDSLAAFTAEHREVVLKPLGGRAGQGVVFAAAGTPGLGALLELVTAQQTLPVMVQAFLPGVSAGDKRILLVDGEPLGAVNRVPSGGAGGEFRSNLAVGGQPEATELSAVERCICAELAPALRAEGLFFVGIDVIDGRLSEINVTSPTGIREVERLGGVPLADLTLKKLAWTP